MVLVVGKVLRWWNIRYISKEKSWRKS